MTSVENLDRTSCLTPDETERSLQGLQSVTLAGYQLQSMLGSGGYGEVYRAIGPGGLAKAVKVLYGQRNGQHAEAELKSLQRVRDLRHPFLLNIERIEICNNRLIVVTELADRNLEDRFNECREQGLAGIPREELLGYLSDAADALDFMYEQHGLQHLDIKPDNLLLQGNHVKVGDFGLAKDVSVTAVSLVNGFTPLFAAPEIFEGRPGRSSDQYSLAIVFQTMLTGTLPFNGRTAAQLTAQHLRSQPDLTGLQPVDRPVISRALAKNPLSRYENSRQLVDELARRKPARSVPATRGGSPMSVAGDTRTPLINPVSGSEDGRGDETSQPVMLDPSSATTVRLHPTVFVGVGGLAGEVLQSLKSELLQKTKSAVPALGFLQLDTSRHDLKMLVESAVRDGLGVSETLHLPLRSSQEYRSDKEMHLSWLSRRWLFNIPRSGNVEGIRPLGRLALCDHQQTVRGRIRELICQVREPQAVAASAEALDTEFDADCLDIVIVAASCGGTSSGAAMDVGYLVRQVLSSESVKQASVRGLMLHGTGPVRNITDVQEANTVSCLQELQTLSTPGLGISKGFPESGLDGDLCPFDDTYLFHCGDGLNSQGFTAAARNVARYLLADSASAAAQRFRSWRNSAAGSTAGSQPIRLLGVAALDQQVHEAASREASVLRSELLRKWMGPATDRVSGGNRVLHCDPAAPQKLLGELQLTEDTLSRQLMGLLRGQIGHRIEQFSEHVFELLSPQCQTAAATRAAAVTSLAQLTADNGPIQLSGTLNEIRQAVQEQLQQRYQEASDRLSQYLLQALNSADRLPGANAALVTLDRQLRATVLSCRRLAAEIERTFDALAGDADSTADTSAETLDQQSLQNLCREYCVLVAYKAVYQALIAHVLAVRKHIEQLTVALNGFRSRLNELLGEVSTAGNGESALPEPVVDAFDSELRRTHPDWPASLLDEHCDLSKFACRLLDQAAAFLLTAADKAGSTETGSGSGQAGFPANAWPGFRGLGGRRRVLAQLPENESQQDWQQKLQQVFGPCTTIQKASDGCLLVVCEIEDINIDRVLKRLTSRNPHIGDIAGRIHTRIDVNW